MFPLPSEIIQNFQAEKSVGIRMGGMLCTRMAAHDYGGEAL
jgi:hypothetical protein